MRWGFIISIVFGEVFLLSWRTYFHVLIIKSKLTKSFTYFQTQPKKIVKISKSISRNILKVFNRNHFMFLIHGNKYHIQNSKTQRNHLDLNMDNSAYCVGTLLRNINVQRDSKLVGKHIFYSQLPKYYFRFTWIGNIIPNTT